MFENLCSAALVSIFESVEDGGLPFLVLLPQRFVLQELVYVVLVPQLTEDMESRVGLVI